MNIKYIFLLILFPLAISAQYYNPESVTPETKKFHLGITTGINNFVGIIGPYAEYNLAKNFTLIGGAGLGTWGYKLSFGGRYYLSYPLKSAFGLNYSYATGLPEVVLDLEVVDPNSVKGKSNMKVPVNLKPIHLLNLSYLRFWKMGKYSRFHLEIGYSISLNGRSIYNYKVNDPNMRLTDLSKSVLNTLQPGGLLLGIGFTFGL